MPSTVASIRPDLSWAHWRPAVTTGVWVVALFAIGMLLTRAYAVPLRTELAAHALAVQSNEVYPPPCTVPSSNATAAADKRYSFGAYTMSESHQEGSKACHLKWL